MVLPVRERDYGLVDDVVAPGHTQPAGAHVGDYELQKLLSQGTIPVSERAVH